MSELVILFMGLMMHIGPDGDPDGHFKSHVAIIADAHHTPSVTVVAADGSKMFDIELLAGESLSFSHGTGLAETNQEFRDGVPHIQRLTRTPKQGAKSDLHAKPESADFPHSHVFAYIWYPPASKLSVASHSTCKAQFILDDPTVAARRVAVVNRVDARIPAGTHIEVGRRGAIRLRRLIPGDAIMIVANRADKIDPAHFGHYRHLTNATRIAKVKRVGATCDFDPNPFPQLLTTAPKKAFLEPYPECTNSQWP